MKIPACLAALIFIAQNAFAQQPFLKLDEAINTYVNQEKFTGTVLIAAQGQIILEKGYGLSDVVSKSKNTPASVYQLASLAKTFTASVILKLQEQQKLSVSDQLSKYYPEYPKGERITIAHLLSHTSGISDYVKDQTFRKSDQSRGYIIEKVTGKSYREVLEQLILKPLSLDHAGYDFTALHSDEKATGYTSYSPGNYQSSITIHPSILYTTGALYSTARDLYKWHQALQGSKFLSPASKKAMYTPVNGPYGYGWFTDSLFGRKRVSHDGNVAGFKTNMNRFPDDDLCVIVLSNSSSSRVGEMVRVLVSILFDQPYQLPVERQGIRVAEELLKAFCGNYQIGPQTQITITMENNRLFIHGGGLPKMELFAETQTSFFGKTMDLKIEFATNELYFYQGKQKYKGKKVK